MNTVIEIRLYRGGWQCFEAPGVQPYWTGDSAKQSAIDYAKARAFGSLRYSGARRKLNVIETKLNRSESLTLTVLIVVTVWGAWCHFLAWRHAGDRSLSWRLRRKYKLATARLTRFTARNEIDNCSNALGIGRPSRSRPGLLAHPLQQ